MFANKFIKKLRFFGLISFLVPLITINVCLALFSLIGTVEPFPDLNWSNKKIEFKKEVFHKKFGNLEYINTWKLITCPINVTTEYALTDEDELVEITGDGYNELISNNKIKSFFLIQQNVKEVSCVKNYKIPYFLLKNIKGLEKLILYAKKNNKSGFTKIRNPYIYGEVSISRTARYYPANYIFKPFIILSSILLFFYWLNNLNLFRYLENNNSLKNPSKTFFIFGSLSCLFLMLHAVFLGIDFDSKVFLKLRRLIIILFIIFEICAQVYLIKNLYKFKDELKNYINILILKIKIYFVTIVVFSTVIIFALLAFGDINTSTKHVLEWNYFSILLIYYLLSFFLWKNSKISD